MPRHRLLSFNPYASGRPAVWRLVTAALLLAVLTQPGLVPALAAPAPRSAGAAGAP